VLAEIKFKSYEFWDCRGFDDERRCLIELGLRLLSTTWYNIPEPSATEVQSKLETVEKPYETDVTVWRILLSIE
jgi:hypothetical protein